MAGAMNSCPQAIADSERTKLPARSACVADVTVVREPSPVQHAQHWLECLSPLGACDRCAAAQVAFEASKGEYERYHTLIAERILRDAGEHAGDTVEPLTAPPHGLAGLAARESMPVEPVRSLSLYEAAKHLRGCGGGYCGCSAERELLRSVLRDGESWADAVTRIIREHESPATTDSVADTAGVPPSPQGAGESPALSQRTIYVARRIDTAILYCMAKEGCPTNAACGRRLQPGSSRFYRRPALRDTCPDCERRWPLLINEPGRKDDQGKARLDLLPFRALERVARVLEYGATKYGEDNWRTVEHAERRYVAAALRHLFAFARGERRDADSGEPHLAHAAACVLFLLDSND